MLQVWSSIEDVAGPQLRTKIGVIEVKHIVMLLNLYKCGLTNRLARHDAVFSVLFTAAI